MEGFNLVFLFLLCALKIVIGVERLAFAWGGTASNGKFVEYFLSGSLARNILLVYL